MPARQRLRGPDRQQEPSLPLQLSGCHPRSGRLGDKESHNFGSAVTAKGRTGRRGAIPGGVWQLEIGLAAIPALVRGTSCCKLWLVAMRKQIFCK